MTVDESFGLIMTIKEPTNLTSVQPVRTLR